MVFAVQCPDPNCRKYMLVEEHDRGKVIPCLICKTPIQVAATTSSSEKVATGKKKDSPYKATQ
jgi:hypothetical protein